MGTFSVTVPRLTEWSPKVAVALIKTILDERTSTKAISFLYIASHRQVDFKVRFSADEFSLAQFSALVRQYYPLSNVENKPESQRQYPFHRRYTIFTRPNPLFYEFALQADEIKSPDPLSLLTQITEDLQPNERLVFTIQLFDRVTLSEADIGGAIVNDSHNINERVTPYPINKGIAHTIVSSLWESYRGESPRTLRVPSSKARNYVNKLRQKLYQVMLMLHFDTPDPTRHHIFTSASNIIKGFSPPQSNLIGDDSFKDVFIQNSSDWDKLHPSSAIDSHWYANKDRKAEQIRQEWIDRHSFYCLPEELAAMWHLPHKEFSASNIVWMKSGSVRLPNIMLGRREGTLLGRNEYAGHTEPVYLTSKERATHLHIVGKAGTGKSSLLHHLITQDIRQHKGVAVIDPHGQLVRDILRLSIPSERMQDVVLIDLANEAYPPPFNLLVIPQSVNQNNAAGRLMTILDKHGSFADTVTVAPTLRAALVTLWQEITPTIRDVVRVFNNDAYRTKLLETNDNPVVEDFWDMFVTKSSGQREQLVSPIVTRMSDLYGNPYLYPAICHPDMLDFSSLIAQRKIILISLAVDKGIVPPIDQRLLGSIVLFQMQNAVMNGAAADNPFYLYVDEAHHFITAPLDEMLVELRKFNLSITLAHQFLKQLEGETLEAIMGAVGTTIAFQCSPDDARTLNSYMKSGFTTDDLINLDLYNAAVYMRSGAQTLPAFSLSTEKPLAVLLNSLSAEKIAQIHRREQNIRQLSIQQYTPKSRQAVLEWLRRRYKRPGQSEGDEILVDPTS